MAQHMRLTIDDENTLRLADKFADEDDFVIEESTVEGAHIFHYQRMTLVIDDIDFTTDHMPQDEMEVRLYRYGKLIGVLEMDSVSQQMMKHIKAYVHNKDLTT